MSFVFLIHPMEHQQGFAGTTPVPTISSDASSSTVWKEIRYVKPGDLVITHLGNVRPVSRISVTPLAGRKMRRVRIAGMDAEDDVEFRVTDDHRFWATTSRDSLAPAWTAARDLNTNGDQYVGVLPTRSIALAMTWGDVIFLRVLANDEIDPTEDDERIGVFSLGVDSEEHSFAVGGGTRYSFGVLVEDNCG